MNLTKWSPKTTADLYILLEEVISGDQNANPYFWNLTCIPGNALPLKLPRHSTHCSRYQNMLCKYFAVYMMLPLPSFIFSQGGFLLTPSATNGVENMCKATRSSKFCRFYAGKMINFYASHIICINLYKHNTVHDFA